MGVDVSLGRVFYFSSDRAELRGDDQEVLVIDTKQGRKHYSRQSLQEMKKPPSFLGDRMMSGRLPDGAEPVAFAGIDRAASAKANRVAIAIDVYEGLAPDRTINYVGNLVSKHVPEMFKDIRQGLGGGFFAG